MEQDRVTEKESWDQELKENGESIEAGRGVWVVISVVDEAIDLEWVETNRGKEEERIWLDDQTRRD